MLMATVCIILILLFSIRWYEMTLEIQEENRQQRISKLIDWRPVSERGEKTKKRGLFVR